MSVTYTAVLPARDETVQFLERLLEAERARRGTRAGTRALTCVQQAVLVARWFLDGTRATQLATDNKMGKSAVYDSSTRPSTCSPSGRRRFGRRCWARR